jgi:hypothetical protein
MADNYRLMLPSLGFLLINSQDVILKNKVLGDSIKHFRDSEIAIKTHPCYDCPLQLKSFNKKTNHNIDQVNRHRRPLNTLNCLIPSFCWKLEQKVTLLIASDKSVEYQLCNWSPVADYSSMGLNEKANRKIQLKKYRSRWRRKKKDRKLDDEDLPRI